jgi:alkylated DNA nucleotide flippase Atl1
VDRRGCHWRWKDTALVSSMDGEPGEASVGHRVEYSPEELFQLITQLRGELSTVGGAVAGLAQHVGDGAVARALPATLNSLLPPEARPEHRFLDSEDWPVLGPALGLTGVERRLALASEIRGTFAGFPLPDRDLKETEVWRLEPGPHHRTSGFAQRELTSAWLELQEWVPIAHQLSIASRALLDRLCTRLCATPAEVVRDPLVGPVLTTLKELGDLSARRIEGLVLKASKDEGVRFAAKAAEQQLQAQRVINAALGPSALGVGVTAHLQAVTAETLKQQVKAAGKKAAIAGASASSKIPAPKTDRVPEKRLNDK